MSKTRPEPENAPETVTDWDRIRQRAGRDDSIFPNRRVYLFASLIRVEDDKWLGRFKREAEERGLEVASKNGHLYVLLPVGT